VRRVPENDGSVVNTIDAIHKRVNRRRHPMSSTQHADRLAVSYSHPVLTTYSALRQLLLRGATPSSTRPSSPDSACLAKVLRISWRVDKSGAQRVILRLWFSRVRFLVGVSLLRRTCSTAARSLSREHQCIMSVPLCKHSGFRLTSQSIPRDTTGFGSPVSHS